MVLILSTPRRLTFKKQGGVWGVSSKREHSVSTCSRLERIPRGHIPHNFKILGLGPTRAFFSLILKSYDMCPHL